MTEAIGLGKLLSGSSGGAGVATNYALIVEVEFQARAEDDTLLDACGSDRLERTQRIASSHFGAATEVVDAIKVQTGIAGVAILVTGNKVLVQPQFNSWINCPVDAESAPVGVDPILLVAEVDFILSAEGEIIG